MFIGLTGSMAAGKSTAAKIIADLGYPIVDADKIAHEILFDKKIKDELANSFGEGILDDSGEINRRSLARAAFSSGKSELLNSITHPAICERLFTLARQHQKQSRIVILDVPLLIETGLNRGCDRVILITADTDERYRRIMLRDGLSRAEAEARIKNQMPQHEKEKYADFIIENDGNIASLKEKLTAVIERINGELNEKEEEK